jgi:hypothetical protein
VKYEIRYLPTPSPPCGGGMIVFLSLSDCARAQRSRHYAGCRPSLCQSSPTPTLFPIPRRLISLQDCNPPIFPCGAT